MLTHSSSTASLPMTGSLSMPEYVSRFKSQLLNLKYKYDIATSREPKYRPPADSFEVSGSPMVTGSASKLSSGSKIAPTKLHRKLSKHQSLPALHIKSSLDM